MALLTLLIYCLQVVKCLVDEGGANVNNLKKGGGTIFHVAAKHSQIHEQFVPSIVSLFIHIFVFNIR